MKRVYVLLVVLLLPGFLLAAETPEDIHQSASIIFEQAKQAEQKGDMELAWQRYSKALMLLRRLEKSSPDWKKEVVAADIKVCAGGAGRTAPLMVKEFDQSLLALKLLSVQADELVKKKQGLLKQVNWERDTMYDRIDKLMLDFIVLRTGRSVAAVSAARADRAREEAEQEEKEGTPEIAEGGEEQTGGEQTGGEAVQEAGLTAVSIDAQLMERQQELGAKDLTTVDSDGDDVSDADEILLGTNPDRADTDGDGFWDGDEVETGNDPTDSSSFPQTYDVDDYDEGNVQWEDIELEDEEE
jgi:hypothetical protein